MLSKLELSTLAKTLLQGSVQEGRPQVNALEKQAASLVALQNMRENAALIKTLYDEYPDLDGVSFQFYRDGPEEMDFIVQDVVVKGEDDDEFEEELQDTLSDYPGSSPLSGQLNSDSDMLKFYNVLPDGDTSAVGRILDTTRARVNKGLQGGDVSTLAAELFPYAWAEHAHAVGLHKEGKRSPRLTIFAETESSYDEGGPLAMIDIGLSWLEKAEQMARFSCANKVNITIPTYFWLGGDNEYQSSAHEATIVPGTHWNAELAMVQFSAYEHDESQTPVRTTEIGLSEIRQAFENGWPELYIDFGQEGLDEELAMRVFNLVRGAEGSVVEAPQATPGSRPSMG